jgi:sulfur relay (sulfurtransferase) DsrF/TusC family protein
MAHSIAPQKAAPPQKPDYTKDATIKTFAQYQKALAAYYLALGQKPLTDAQIHHFLRTNHLDRVFGITISDVREDLQALCAKQKPAAAKVPTFSNNIQQVDSYDKYMYALELAYLRNGKVMLTKEQISAFLSAHDLSRKFKILPSEVEADLRTIARKYT